MRSGLSALNFKKKLKKHTRLGSAFSNMSPLALFEFMKDYDKTFLGEFSKNEFSLTKNSIFNRTWYKIEGTYTEINETECTVEYAVKTIYWFKVLNIIGLVINSLVMLFFSFVLVAFFIKNVFVAGVILIGVICLVILLPVYLQKYNKRRLEESFKRIFKIDD